MKRFFLLSALLLGTLVSWADDYSAVVYPDCNQDTITRIIPASLDTMAHWMEFFSDTTPLFDLVIPGTHESGTWFYKGQFEDNVKDQVYDYKDTWDLGARVFDLRIAFEDYDTDWQHPEVDYTEASHFHHGDNDIPGYIGIGTMNTIVDDIANHFPTLEQLENECMILFAKKEWQGYIIYVDFYGNQYFSEPDMNKVYEVFMTSLLDKYGSDRFIAYHPGMTLGESRGKIMLFDQTGFDITDTRIPVNYMPTLLDDWDIRTTVETPVNIYIYENGVNTHTYTDNYSQNIYDLGKEDSCSSGIQHKIEAITALAKKWPSGGMDCCVNLWNCYCMGTILPHLWSGTGTINDSISTLLHQDMLYARGMHMLDFYGVDSYSDENFHGMKAARELVMLNFRLRNPEFNLKLNAAGCDTYNEYAYGSLVNTDITAEHQNGRYFSQWSDDNLDNPRSIWLTRDTAFTAIYNYNKLYQDNNRNGIDYNFTGRDCSTDDCSDAKTITLATNLGSATNIIRYVDDTLTTTIKLVLDTNAIAQFIRWSDGSTDTVRVVSVTTDTTFTAIFLNHALNYQDCNRQSNTFDFTGRDCADNECSDVVTIKIFSDECSDRYSTVLLNEGDSVCIEPIAKEGYHFTQWSDGVLDYMRMYAAAVDTQFTAQFEESTVVIKQSGNDQYFYDFTGNQCVDDSCSNAVKIYVGVEGSDSVITVNLMKGYTGLKMEAQADPGSYFLRWSDSNTDNPRFVADAEGFTFRAEFADYEAPIYQDCSQDGQQYDYVPGGGDWEYIDLGLPSGKLWAPTNLEATSPEELGGRYAWGEVYSRDTFPWDYYKWFDENRKLTKYCSNREYGIVDSKTRLEDGDDPTRWYMHGRWRMPTKDELQELIDNCTWDYTTINDMICMQGTGHNGNTIILPIDHVDGTTQGWYFSCDKDGVSSEDQAWILLLNHDQPGRHPIAVTESRRFWGSSIRAVQDPLPSKKSLTIYAQGCDDKPNVVTCPPGTQVSITAYAMEGSYFLQWSDSVTDNPRRFQVDDDMSATAQFVTYPSVYWDCDKNGQHFDYHLKDRDPAVLMLSADSCEQVTRYIFNRGDSLLITAESPSEAVFDHWSDGVTDNPRKILLSSDTTIRAIYKLTLPDIHINSDSTQNGLYVNYGVSDNGHEYVDLGLPSGTTWATENMESTSKNPAGGRYAWGESFVKDYYNLDNYTYYNFGRMIKYNSSDQKQKLDLENDVANVQWGGMWQMPTGDMMNELLTQCTWTEGQYQFQGEDNKVSGMYVTGPNGLSIFLPYTDRDDDDVYMNYWTSEISDAPEYNNARTLNGTSDNLHIDQSLRQKGLHVRGVRNTAKDYYFVILHTEGSEKRNTYVVSNSYESIVISANAEEGYRFVQWSDGVTDNPRTIRLESDVDLSAIYAKNEIIVSNDCDNMTNSSLPPVDCPSGDCDSLHVLTIQVVGCERTDTIRFADTLITALTANPAEGYVFVGWSDGSVDSSHVVKLSSDTAFTATFYRDVTDTIYQDCSQNGATYDYRTTEADTRRILLYADSCAAADTILVNYGAVLTTTVVPQAGYNFARWSDGVSVNPRVDTVSTDTIFRAEFLHARNIPVYFDCAQNDSVFDLRSSDRDVDTVRLSADNCDVSSMVLINRGSSFTMEALAPIGCQFLQWTDSITDNPRTVVVGNDTAFTAQYIRLEVLNYSDCDKDDVLHFEPDSCQHGGDCNTWLGKVINPDCKQRFCYFYFMDSINLYLVPKTSIGMHFVSWGDGNIDNPRLISPHSDTIYHINFALNEIDLYQDGTYNDTIYDFTNNISLDSTHIHTITVCCKDSNITQKALFMDSCQVTLAAMPNLGYRFAQWSDGDTLATRTLTLYGDTIISAEFTKDEVVVYQDCDRNGSLYDYRSSEQDVVTVLLAVDSCTVMDTILINAGDTMTIRAVTNPNAEFRQWSDGVTDSARIFVPETDTLLTAQFSLSIPITLTADSAQKIVGASDTTFTWQITDGELYPGDTIVGVSLTRDQGEDPGVYTIHVEVADSLNPKYNITTQDGHMRIYDGEHRMPKDATKTTIGYESEHWYNRENGIYYTDGYMNEMIADSVPLTTYLMYDDIRHDCRKFDFQSYYDLFGHTFSYIAVTTYKEDNDTDTKWAEFSVAHPNVSNARLLWYKNWADPNYGQFNINVLLNDTTVFYIHQEEFQLLGGFNAVYFSALKQNDIVRFQVERPNPAQWGATVTVAAVLQYTHPDGDITRIESVNADGSRQGVKFIRDGQLFILRDDKLYNAQGQRITTY